MSTGEWEDDGRKRKQRDTAHSRGAYFSLTVRCALVTEPRAKGPCPDDPRLSILDPKHEKAGLGV